MEDGGGPQLPTEDITYSTATPDPCARGSATKRAALPAAHEVRQLREEVQRLERQLAGLRRAWRAALLQHGPAHAGDARVLVAACAAAREKARTARVERQNGELRDQLMQQQLFYASLQDQLARRAPLAGVSARASALFASLHAPLRLSARRVTDGADGPSVRRQQLQHRVERGVAEAEGVMDAFTRELLPLASPYLPYSSTSVAPSTIRQARGGAPKAGTLVSNVFVCKLPAESDVARVFRLVVDIMKKAPAELSARLGIHLDFSLLDELGPDKYYGRVTRSDGAFKGVATSTVFAAELVHADLGVALMDFVDEDDELADGPAGSSASDGGGSSSSTRSSFGSDPGDEPPLGIDTCMLVTVSRMDAGDGGEEEGEREGARRQPILLRRLRVHRYNLPPHSPTLHRDLEAHQPFLNGDLHLEMLSAAVAREGAGANSSASASSVDASKTEP